MASVHDPINDVGPELVRKVGRDVVKFARRFTEIAHATTDCRTAGDLAQAEADRLLDEEAAHARR